MVVRRIPTGGQGGGKQALQIVAMLALVVAAGYVGGGSLAAGSWFLEGSMSAKVLAAGLLVSGSLTLNGRIPAPLPRRSLPVRTLPEAA